jgi:hypothetical protein
LKNYPLPLLLIANLLSCLQISSPPSFSIVVAVKIPRFVFDYILMKSESFAQIVATPVILK